MSHTTFAYPYIGVLLALIMSIAVFGGLLHLQHKISNAIAKKDREKLKLAPYECGVTPNKQSNTISSSLGILGWVALCFLKCLAFLHF